MKVKVLTLLLGAVAFAAIAFATPPTQAQPCQEDQPCWNCATMGNHICGDPLEFLLGTPPVPVTVYKNWTEMMLHE